MKIRIIKKSKTKTTFLNRIIAVLFGIFLTSIIFSLTIKTMEEIGIYIGLAICAILIFLGFYLIKKGTIPRMIAWGILGTTLIGVIAYIVGLAVLDNLLEGFTS